MISICMRLSHPPIRSSVFSWLWADNGWSCTRPPSETNAERPLCTWRHRVPGRTRCIRRPASCANFPLKKCRITTLQDFVEVAGLDHITLVKIDTEGHDLAVLRGAQALLEQRRISVVQFEYNHRWVYSRSFLCDAFDLLRPLGYCLGKLTPLGVEFYPGWDPDLETFVEGNYVACSSEIVG